MQALGGLIVHPAKQVALFEGRRESACERLEGRRWCYTGSRVLQRSFSVRKEEQLILDYRTADVTTFLAPLVRSISGKFGALGVGPEQAVALTVEAVGSGLGDHVDRAGRSEFVRKIEAGLCQLEFGNGAGRNAFRGRANVFVAHIHAVNFDSRRAAKPAAE